MISCLYYSGNEKDCKMSIYWIRYHEGPERIDESIQNEGLTRNDILFKQISKAVSRQRSKDKRETKEPIVEEKSRIGVMRKFPKEKEKPVVVSEKGKNKVLI